MDTKEKDIEAHPDTEAYRIATIKYKQLLNKVKTDPFYKTNIRICNYGCDECGFITRTVKQDTGVVPSTIKCIKCGEYSNSIGINGGNTGVYDIAWHRPVFDIFYTLKEEIQKHILLGGLIPNPEYRSVTSYEYKTKNQKKRYRRKNRR